MTRKLGIIRLACLAAVVASVAFGTACIHRPYRAYDSYYNDYHQWTDREADYYRQWCSETHRDSGRDFRKLAPTMSRRNTGNGGTSLPTTDATTRSMTISKINKILSHHLEAL